MSEAFDTATDQAAETQPATNTVATVYTGAAVVLDPIEAVLKGLETRHKDVVFDLSTTKGNKAARAARQELVSVRTGADAAYRNWNAPLLEEQRKARERVADIKTRVKALEEPIDAQIKADEERREAERLERERLNAERIAKIRERIANISNLPTLVVTMSSEEIGAVIDDLAVLELTEERYGEFLEEAQSIYRQVAAKLQEMHGAAQAREQAEEQVRIQQAELERQRAELAAAQAELERQRAEHAEAARRDQILREEQARHAADKAARDADDARRAAAGQTDAFPHERREAIETIATAAQRSCSAPAGRVPEDPSVVAPPIHPDPYVEDPQGQLDAINAAASEAAATDGDSDVVIAPKQPAPWAPDALFVVDALAHAARVDAEQALAWLQSIDFSAVSAQELRDGQ